MNKIMLEDAFRVSSGDEVKHWIAAKADIELGLAWGERGES